MSTNGLPPSPSEITKEEREGRIPACILCRLSILSRLCELPGRARPYCVIIGPHYASVRSCSPCRRLPPSSLPSLLPFPRTEIIFWIGTSCCTECRPTPQFHIDFKPEDTLLRHRHSGSLWSYYHSLRHPVLGRACKFNSELGQSAAAASC